MSPGGCVQDPPTPTDQLPGVPSHPLSWLLSAPLSLSPSPLPTQPPMLPFSPGSLGPLPGFRWPPVSVCYFLVLPGPRRPWCGPGPGMGRGWLPGAGSQELPGTNKAEGGGVDNAAVQGAWGWHVAGEGEKPLRFGFPSHRAGRGGGIRPSPHPPPPPAAGDVCP